MLYLMRTGMEPKMAFNIMENVRKGKGLTEEMASTMKKYNISKCIYGHIHGEGHKEAKEGKFFGIEFKLVSSDYLDFKLIQI